MPNSNKDEIIEIDSPGVQNGQKTFKYRSEEILYKNLTKLLDDNKNFLFLIKELSTKTQELIDCIEKEKPNFIKRNPQKLIYPSIFVLGIFIGCLFADHLSNEYPSRSSLFFYFIGIGVGIFASTLICVFIYILNEKYKCLPKEKINVRFSDLRHLQTLSQLTINQINDFKNLVSDIVNKNDYQLIEKDSSFWNVLSWLSCEFIYQSLTTQINVYLENLSSLKETLDEFQKTPKFIVAEEQIRIDEKALNKTKRFLFFSDNTKEPRYYLHQLPNEILEKVEKYSQGEVIVERSIPSLHV